MAARIGIVGSANMDLVVRAACIPLAGENVLGDEFLTIPGGKGANQAVAAARLGADAVFIGRVGDDTFGERLLTGLNEDGVDTSCVKVVPNTASGIAMIVVAPNGQHTIVICPNANRMLLPQDIRALQDVIGELDALLMQLEIPPETVVETVRICRGLGVPVILDAGPPRDALPPEAMRVTILSPNEDEAGKLVKRKIQNATDAELAGRELLDRGAQSVVLKLGRRGAVVVTPDGCVRVPACNITPVDTTAAGDAFTAALGVFTAEGMELAEAVRMANRAGAIAATRLGAQTSLPTRAEVEAFEGN